MGKYNSNKLSSKFVQNYLKYRLWKRNNSEYVPLLNVRSLPSEGKSNRILGWKTGREHHFLSRLEYAVFYHFKWSSNIIDIKEQYPLLPIEILQNIALKTGIPYPSLKNEPIIMTTDFLVTEKKDGNIIKYAKTIKPSTELSNPRIIEKFEIERRFFNSQNIDWGIITEKELPEIFTANMDILHSNRLFNSEISSEKQIKFNLYNHLIEAIKEVSNNNITLVHILAELSSKLNVNLSYITEIFFKAIIDKIIILDIYNKPLNITLLTRNDIKVNNNKLLFKLVNA